MKWRHKQDWGDLITKQIGFVTPEVTIVGKKYYFDPDGDLEGKTLRNVWLHLHQNNLAGGQYDFGGFFQKNDQSLQVILDAGGPAIQDATITLKTTDNKERFIRSPLANLERIVIPIPSTGIPATNTIFGAQLREVGIKNFSITNTFIQFPSAIPANIYFPFVFQFEL